MPDPVPHDIRQLGDERARARRARDWATADRLKAELEAAGWRVVDAATLYSLERLPPAVVEVDGDLRYGSSEAVPSRLDEPATQRATAVLVADDAAGLLPTSVAALLTHAPGTQVVVVANAPSEAVEAEIGALPPEVEVVRLATRLGAAAARNAGVRRARGAAVVLLSPRVVAEGDLIGALAAPLDDPSVGVAGIRGLVTDDFVHFEAAPPDATEADTVDLRAMAFRREDAIARGPLDEHFTLEAYLDAWWGFMLREADEGDEAEGAAAEADEAGAADDAGGADDAGAADAFAMPAPRRAVVVAAPCRLLGDEPPAPDERLSKKHRYRFLKSFAARRDLLTRGAAE